MSADAMRATGPGYRATLATLAGSQKQASRSAPPYSVYVNRRLGRYAAAWAHGAGLTPNAVTTISAALTVTALVLLVSFPPTLPLGLAVGLLLAAGYVMDSADGQLARLTGASSPAGEWLDHIIDATKTSALPIAVAVGFFRFDAVNTVWLIVPLVAAVVCPVLFFGMILTEQLRRQAGRPGVSTGPGRSYAGLLLLPMDYGITCLSFLLLGMPQLFVAVYAVIVGVSLLFLLTAAVKWFREISSWPASAERGRHAA